MTVGTVSAATLSATLGTAALQATVAARAILGDIDVGGPVIEEIAQEREDITVGKVNVDEEMELAIRFGVASIPMLVVLEKGQIVNKAIGYRPKAEIEALL